MRKMRQMSRDESTLRITAHFLQKYLEERESTREQKSSVRSIKSNYVRERQSFLAVTKQKTERNTESLEMIKEINDINKMYNLKRMLIVLKETKARLVEAKSEQDTLMIILELCDNLND